MNNADPLNGMSDIGTGKIGYQGKVITYKLWSKNQGAAISAELSCNRISNARQKMYTLSHTGKSDKSEAVEYLRQNMGKIVNEFLHGE